VTDDPVTVVSDADRQLEARRLFRNRFQVHLAKVLGLLDLGRMDDARAACDALDRERGDGTEPAVALAAAWCELAWHTDDPALARKALDLGRSVADAYFGIHLLTERTAALVLHLHGDVVAPLLPRVSMPAWWPALHELEALRLLSAGDPVAGSQEMQRAADHWEAMHVHRWAVRAGVLASELASAVGDRDAPARRRRYVELARRTGVAGTLRRLGHAVHPDLTPTEEAVLQQVARGATTREVADQLRMSPATVDQHVESARHKLGAATRLEAALRIGS
jgi:DNA-binding CsgD family transcriptional regulator